MSEAAAVSSAPETGASQGQSAAAGAGKPGQTSTQAKAGAGAPKASSQDGPPKWAGGASSPSKGEAKADSKAQAPATAEDDSEEIAIGSVRGRVPKQLAHVIKQLERGFHSKSQEAARERQERESLIRTIKENPGKAMRDAGRDPDEWAEMTLAEKLEALSMSPEEKARRAEQEELKALRAEKEKAAKDAEAREEQAKTQEAVQSLDKDIAEAWQKSGLPQDIFYVKQMAALMREAHILHSQGRLQRPLTAERAAAIVKSRFEQTNTKLLQSLDAEALYKLIGDEKFNQLREWDLARVTGQASQIPGSAKRPGDEPASDETPRKKMGPMNEREWRKFWDES